MPASEPTAADLALLAIARDYAGRALAPISHYHVGAALRCRDQAGAVRSIGGCNVEHIVLSLSSCAERVAVFTAVAEGMRTLEAVAVHTISSPPAAPCGSCRQMLHTFKVERVIMGNDRGEVRVLTMSELLPYAFELEGPLPTS